MRNLVIVESPAKSKTIDRTYFITIVNTFCGDEL